MELPASTTRMTSRYIIVNAQPGLLAKIVKVWGYLINHLAYFALSLFLRSPHKALACPSSDKQNACPM